MPLIKGKGRFMYYLNINHKKYKIGTKICCLEIVSAVFIAIYNWFVMSLIGKRLVK